MTIDRKSFIDNANEYLFGGRMTLSQIDGALSTIDEFERRGLTNMDHLAYFLATQKHETAHTMQPVRETLAKTDAEARRNLAGVWYAAVDHETGQSYYGRGDTQNTHRRNYQKMQDQLHGVFKDKYKGFDLVRNPDLALMPDVSKAMMFEAMLDGETSMGDYTGLSLEDFTRQDGSLDFLNARKVVNGMDKAADIADLAVKFRAALVGAPPPPRLLQYGASGADVRKLQEALRSRAYLVHVDGDFGPATRAAVIAFQRSCGIAADGVVGAVTRNKLGMNGGVL